MFTEVMETLNEKALDREYLETASKEAADGVVKSREQKENNVGSEQKEDRDDVIEQKTAENNIKTVEKDIPWVLDNVKGSTPFIEEALDRAGPEVKQQYLMAKTWSSNTAEDDEKENKEANIEKVQQ